jgi:DNA-binding FadR family transcriptional regulator
MKKLESLGVACVQPGGARVAPVGEASLDVIGHMLAVREVPDASLVDQIMQVISGLVQLAVESAVRTASDADIDRLRALARRLSESVDKEAHMDARLQLLVAIMEASGNLPCRLIARSLLLQMAPRLAPLEAFMELDVTTRSNHAERLDAALAERDVATLREVFEAFSQSNRDQINQAIRAFAVERAAAASEAAAS